MEAYPPTYTTVKRHAKRVQGERTDTHQPARTIFQQGYEQAEKDTIERAVRWIAENTKKYVGPIKNPFWDMFLKHFRKYMEEE